MFGSKAGEFKSLNLHISVVNTLGQEILLLISAFLPVKK
jgi:hypothetical protein